MRTKVIRSPLRWAGSKRWLVPALRSLVFKPYVTSLIDVFAGAGNVAYNFPELEVTYRDVDPHLYNFFSQGGIVVGEQQPSQDWYYDIRERFNALQDKQGAEAAKLFYLLNRFSVNGICRFNKKGLYNSPYCKRDSSPYLRYVEKPKFKVEHRPYTKGSVPDNSPETAIYCDPPYAYPGEPSIGLYYGGWTYDQTLALATDLSEVTGPVILSYAMVPDLVLFLLKLKYEVFVLQAPRRINFKGDRKKEYELLAVRNLPGTKAILDAHGVLAEEVYRR